MLSGDSSPYISNTCYEVVPFSLTHLLANVGATVSRPLGVGGDVRVTHLFVGVSRKVVQVIVDESLDFIWRNTIWSVIKMDISLCKSSYTTQMCTRV